MPWSDNDRSGSGRTLMSSRSRKLRTMPLRFQTMGGRSAPRMLQVRTALRPTVMVVTATLWSSGRLSRTTSAKGTITGITSNTTKGSCSSSLLSAFLSHSGNNFGGFHTNATGPEVLCWAAKAELSTSCLLHTVYPDPSKKMMLWCF